MAINRQNLISGFAGAAMGAAALLAPTIANAEGLTIKYGNQSDVAKVERSLMRAERRDGLQVELVGGLGETDCFALFNEAGQEIVRVGPKEARDIVLFARDLERGEIISPVTVAVSGASCHDNE